MTFYDWYKKILRMKPKTYRNKTIGKFVKQIQYNNSAFRLILDKDNEEYLKRRLEDLLCEYKKYIVNKMNLEIEE